MVALITPIEAVADALIVRVIELTALVQGSAALAVKVRVTLPAVISAALGTYKGFSVEALGVNDPVPLVVHCRLV
jgi:hypothetical protein